MTPPRGGTVTFAGRRLSGLTSFRIAKLGLGLVPEGRGILHVAASSSPASPSSPARWNARRNRRHTRPLIQSSRPAR